MLKTFLICFVPNFYIVSYYFFPWSWLMHQSMNLWLDTQVLLFQDSFQKLNHSICYKCPGIPSPITLVVTIYNVDENLLKVMTITHNTNQAIDQLSEVTSLRLFYRNVFREEIERHKLVKAILSFYKTWNIFTIVF